LAADGGPRSLWHPATAALNSLVCDHHPIIIQEGNKRGWEWMGHNETNTRRLNEAPPGERR